MHGFIQFLANLRHGDLVEKLDRELEALTLGCQETGKKGKITLTFEIKPGKAGRVDVSDDVKTKIPEFDKDPTILFVTTDGKLQKEDPRQIKMDLTVVPHELRDPVKAV